MRVTISTPLNCSPERAWAEVRTSRLLRYVARPLIAFSPVGPTALPAVWSDGSYRVRLSLFGLIPCGKQWIVVTAPREDPSPGGQHYEIRDDGHGDLSSKWDHRVTIRETADGRTRYTDDVDVEAGVLTPLVWAFAAIFYRSRQRRWRRLVDRDFDYGR